MRVPRSGDDGRRFILQQPLLYSETAYNYRRLGELWYQLMHSGTSLRTIACPRLTLSCRRYRSFEGVHAVLLRVSSRKNSRLIRRTIAVGAGHDLQQHSRRRRPSRPDHREEQHGHRLSRSHPSRRRIDLALEEHQELLQRTHRSLVRPGARLVRIERCTRLRSSLVMDLDTAFDGHRRLAVPRRSIQNRPDGIQSARLLYDAAKRHRHVPHPVEEAREETLRYA